MQSREKSETPPGKDWTGTGDHKLIAIPLPTVESVDLARTMRKWYEIALLPTRVESMWAADTRTSYRKDECYIIPWGRRFPWKLQFVMNSANL
jgi:hypothetical protein